MKILLVEDEYSLADAVAEILKKEGFDVKICDNGEDGENEALTGNYDLILLDVMLPKKNGFDILRTVRDYKINTPIIMLTAKSEMNDKLNGLEHGADDYITKPFSTRELLARIKIILKRVNNIDDTNILKFGDLCLNVNNSTLSTENNEIQLSGKELQLLEQLIINKNQVSVKENLLEKIWGYDIEYNNVEVYITFLRRKLNLLQSNVRIKTVRGIGYKLEENND